MIFLEVHDRYNKNEILINPFRIDYIISDKNGAEISVGGKTDENGDDSVFQVSENIETVRAKLRVC